MILPKLSLLLFEFLQGWVKERQIGFPFLEKKTLWLNCTLCLLKSLYVHEDRVSKSRFKLHHTCDFSPNSWLTHSWSDWAPISPSSVHLLCWITVCRSLWGRNGRVNFFCICWWQEVLPPSTDAKWHMFLSVIWPCLVQPQLHFLSPSHTHHLQYHGQGLKTYHLRNWKGLEGAREGEGSR